MLETADSLSARLQTSVTELAGSTGLEPAASGVTGRRSNQLNYDPKLTMVGGTGLEPVTAGV